MAARAKLPDDLTQYGPDEFEGMTTPGSEDKTPSIADG